LKVKKDWRGRIVFNNLGSYHSLIIKIYHSALRRGYDRRVAEEKDEQRVLVRVV
jgi:hypothetical protein